VLPSGCIAPLVPGYTRRSSPWPSAGGYLGSSGEWHVCGAWVGAYACAVRPNALWLVVVQCQKVEGAGTNMEV
jgi:hypothetical protein